MKSIIFAVFLLTVCVSLSFAATGMGLFKDPRYPGKCTINDEVILSPGEETNAIGECARIICGRDSYGEFQSCGSVAPMYGCKLRDYKNINLPYPDCCERSFICE